VDSIHDGGKNHKIMQSAHNVDSVEMVSSQENAWALTNNSSDSRDKNPQNVSA